MAAQRVELAVQKSRNALNDGDFGAHLAQRSGHFQPQQPTPHNDDVRVGRQVAPEAVGIGAAAHREDAGQRGYVARHRGPAAGGQYQHVIVGALPVGVDHEFAGPVDGFHAHAAPQVNAVSGLLGILHFHQLAPVLVPADVVGQHHAVIEREVLLAENGDVIVLVQGAVGRYEAKRPRSGPHHHNALPGLPISGHPHGAKLEIGFLGNRVYPAGGQVVGAVQVGAQYFAPVHGQKHYAWPDAGREARRHPHRAPPRGYGYQVGFAHAQGGGILRVHLQKSLRAVLVELADFARFGHRVPLVAEAAGGEHEREVRIRHLAPKYCPHRRNARPARRRVKAVVGEEPGRFGRVVPVPVGPLHRALRLQNGVGESRNIERGAGREAGMLPVNGFGIGIVEPCKAHGPRKAADDFGIG